MEFIKKDITADDKIRWITMVIVIVIPFKISLAKCLCMGFLQIRNKCKTFVRFQVSQQVKNVLIDGCKKY